MPVDYKKYPSNWKSEIRPRILKRAKNKCERCGVPNKEIIFRGFLNDGTEVYRDLNGNIFDASNSKLIIFTEVFDFLSVNFNQKSIKVILTIAHLDHDETNHDVKDERLMAMCQLCHLRYDAKEKSRRIKQNKINMNNTNTQTELLIPLYLNSYLPYRLNFVVKSNGQILEMNSLNLRCTGVYKFEAIAPILKPLTDLIDNILDDDNDDNYKLSCELAELLNTNDCSYFVKSLLENKYYAIDVRLWIDIEEFLNKNHFDWKYDLIKKGLAVSVNGFNKK